MFDRLKKWLHRVTESTAYSVNPWGDPIPMSYLLAQMANNSVTARDLFPYKASTVRSLEQVNSIMFFGRYLWERNPNAIGLLQGMRSYVVGKGFEVKVCDAEKKGEESDVKEDVPPAPTPEQPEPITAAPTSALARKVQKILDDFNNRHDVKEWFDDSFIRAHRDGDVFIRMFVTPEGATIRAVEPDSVRPPTGENWEGSWSYGIKTPVDDWATPLEYGVQLFDQEWNVVPAGQMFHLKMNVSTNTKRGLSSFFPVQTILDETMTLRDTFRRGETARHAVAYYRQWALAGKDAIVALQTQNATGSAKFSPQNGPYDVTTQRVPAGTVSDVPKGMELIPPVELTGEGAQVAIKEGLYAVAARFNCPSWLVTGESNDTTYASSTTAESPFKHQITDQQETFTKFWRRIYEGVVDAAIAVGDLPEDTLDQVEIHVDAPNSGNRSVDSVDSGIKLRDAGVMSDQTLAAEQGLDYEEEVQKGAAKAELPVDPNKANEKPQPA